MINLSDVTILNDLVERLGKVRDEDIATCDRKLPATEESDVVIGTLASRTTIAIWTLGFMLENEMAMEMVKARMAEDADIEKSFDEQVILLDSLGDVAKELFWAQVRADLGFWKKANISIRKGWMLVEREDKPMSRFVKMMEGG